MQRSGFSLVELSIVLVILGLLVGGVLGGQSLIHAAQLRSVLKETEGFKQAINTFVIQHNELPGDFTRATQLWGTDPAGCGGSIIRQSFTPHVETCDGDGNGLVHSDIYYGERWLIWQHLANAGLIAGQYTGSPGPGNPNTSVKAGVNVPASKFGGSRGYVFYKFPAASVGDQYAFPGKWGNTMQLYNLAGDTYGNTFEGFSVSGEEAFSIDQKIDDGKPGLGMVMSDPTVWGCSTANDPAVSAYNLASSRCSLYFTQFF